MLNSNFGDFADTFEISSATFNSDTNMGDGTDEVTVYCDDTHATDPWHAYTDGIITGVYIMAGSYLILFSCLIYLGLSS